MRDGVNGREIDIQSLFAHKRYIHTSVHAAEHRSISRHWNNQYFSALLDMSSVTPNQLNCRRSQLLVAAQCVCLITSIPNLPVTYSNKLSASDTPKTNFHVNYTDQWMYDDVTAGGKMQTQILENKVNFHETIVIFAMPNECIWVVRHLSRLRLWNVFRLKCVQLRDNLQASEMNRVKFIPNILYGNNLTTIRMRCALRSMTQIKSLRKKEHRPKEEWQIQLIVIVHIRWCA